MIHRSSSVLQGIRTCLNGVQWKWDDSQIMTCMTIGRSRSGQNIAELVWAKTLIALCLQVELESLSSKTTSEQLGVNRVNVLLIAPFWDYWPILISSHVCIYILYIYYTVYIYIHITHYAVFRLLYVSVRCLTSLSCQFPHAFKLLQGPVVANWILSRQSHPHFSHGWHLKSKGHKMLKDPMIENLRFLLCDRSMLPCFLVFILEVVTCWEHFIIILSCFDVPREANPDAQQPNKSVRVHFIRPRLADDEDFVAKN